MAGQSKTISRRALNLFHKNGPRWRWQRAERLAFRNVEPDSYYDCKLVHRAADYLRRQQADEAADPKAEFPDVAGAEELTKAPLLTQLAVQARLLALEPVKEISTRTSMDVRTIRAYEKLFYDFRWARTATDYILFRVAEVDRFRDGTTTLRSSVLTLAYFGGPFVAEAMFDTLSRVELPLDMEKLMAGEGNYSSNDWPVLKALSVDCLPLTKENFIPALKEFMRLRQAARVDAQSPPEAYLGWTEADYAALLQPYLEAELRTLSNVAA